jgi:hypothetical protein
MENKDDIMKKWQPILGNMGVTGSQLGNLAQLAENQSNEILKENTTANSNTSIEFPSLLPIAMKIAAKTIGSEIGGFASKQEIDEVKSRVTQENRDGKLDSILEDKPFTEKRLEDDEEYKELMKKGVTPMSAPSGNLFYLDFQYGKTSSTI